MSDRTGILLLLFACSSFALLNTGLNNYAHAYQNNIEQVKQEKLNKIYGKVTDVREAAGYTYAEVDTGNEKVWAATSTTPVKIGDTIAFTNEMPMKNFHSSSMNRDFPIIYFASKFITDAASQADAGAEGVSPHANIKQVSATGAIKGIDKVAGGHTIAEVYEGKLKLNNQVIRVRGRVTKFTADVMGKNWLHIRDSSTLDDLTVTSDSTVAVDDVVVIEGKLALDKDFGYGYVYPLIVQDASVKKE
ncbi:MAG: hypothetical protein WBO14_09670 [Gammaproteobacteria bacterium]